MTDKFHIPNAVELYEAKKHLLKRGKWGDGVETVCAMSMFVSGAESFEDCVAAGWPEWLANLVVLLFDMDVGAPDEQVAANEFALAVAQAIQTPRDMERVKLWFLIRRLNSGEHSALKSLQSLESDVSEQIEAIKRIWGLLFWQLSGVVFPGAMKTARAAVGAGAETVSFADDPAAAATRAVANAAYAAARAAAYAADDAYAAAVANAADAAAEAAADTHDIALADAYAAARDDLIWALEHS